MFNFWQVQLLATLTFVERNIVEISTQKRDERSRIGYMHSSFHFVSFSVYHSRVKQHNDFTKLVPGFGKKYDVYFGDFLNRTLLFDPKKTLFDHRVGNEKRNGFESSIKENNIPNSDSLRTSELLSVSV